MASRDEIEHTRASCSKDASLRLTVCKSRLQMLDESKFRSWREWRRGTRAASLRGMPDQTISVLDAIYQRRATRAYSTGPVSEADVRVLLRAATHAPTAMHREPWAFVVVQDPAVLARINAAAKVTAAAPHATEHRALARSHDSQLPPPFDDPNFDIFYGAGTLVVICARTAGEFSKADCWLAAENVMLAATGLGLATCPIGFALLGLADPAIQRELEIPAGVTPVAPIIVGTAATTLPATSRRDPEILSWKRVAR